MSNVPDVRTVRLHRALDETKRLLIAHVERTITELQNALTYAATDRHPLDSQLAETALRELVGGEPQAVVQADTVMAVVAEYYGYTTGEFRAPNRTRALAHARQTAMYLCRSLTDLSLPQIGNEFRRDHTTVMYATQAVRDRMAASVRTADQVRDLTVLIQRRAAVATLRSARTMKGIA